MRHYAMIILSLLLLPIFLLLSLRVESGHEVLYKFISNDLDDLKPDELALIQFDSRPVNVERNGKPTLKYWQVSARRNRQFCSRHGHRYFYLSLSQLSSCNIIDGNSNVTIELAYPWCKVKALQIFNSKMHSNIEFNNIKAALFIDSDALVSLKFNHSLSTAINYVRRNLKWDIKKMPVAFNQDGPGWACKSTRKRGYSLCLNSGTVLWFKSALATEILDFWWASAADPMPSTIKDVAETSISRQSPIECTVMFTDRWPKSLNWRLRWPWEQAKQYKVQSCYAANIMILSFPDLPNLPWTSKKDPKSQYPTDSVEPWCFSHWPGADCFITHSAASRNQKRKIVEMYSKEFADRYEDLDTIYID